MQTAATGKEGWETGRVKWTGSPQAVGHTMRSHMLWKTHWKRTVVANKVLCPHQPDLYQGPQLQDKPSWTAWCSWDSAQGKRSTRPCWGHEAGWGQPAGNMEAGLWPTEQAASGWPLPSFSPTISALPKRALLSFFLSFISNTWVSTTKCQSLSIKHGH